MIKKAKKEKEKKKRKKKKKKKKRKNKNFPFQPSFIAFEIESKLVEERGHCARFARELGVEFIRRPGQMKVSPARPYLGVQ